MQQLQITVNNEKLFSTHNLFSISYVLRLIGLINSNIHLRIINKQILQKCLLENVLILHLVIIDYFFCNFHIIYNHC